VSQEYVLRGSCGLWFF